MVCSMFLTHSNHWIFDLFDFFFLFPITFSCYISASMLVLFLELDLEDSEAPGGPKNSPKICLRLTMSLNDAFFIVFGSFGTCFGGHLSVPFGGRTLPNSFFKASTARLSQSYLSEGVWRAFWRPFGCTFFML